MCPLVCRECVCMLFSHLLQTWRASDQLMYGSSSNLFTAAMVCTVMYDDMYTGIYWNILWCTGIYCGVLEYTVVYWNILWCTGIYCGVLEYTVVYWNILWCTGINCGVLRCIGVCWRFILLYWTVMYCGISYLTQPFSHGCTQIAHVTCVGDV